MAIQGLRWNDGVLEAIYEHDGEWRIVRNKSCLAVQIETVKQKPFDPSLEAKGLAAHIQYSLQTKLRLQKVPNLDWFERSVLEYFKKKAGK